MTILTKLFTNLQKYLVALLGALASALAVLYYRKEALFQKSKADRAEGAAESVQEQAEVANEVATEKKKETSDALSDDSYLDYFDR